MPRRTETDEDREVARAMVLAVYDLHKALVAQPWFQQSCLEWAEAVKRLQDEEREDAV
jgi:hypothetical protein